MCYYLCSNLHCAAPRDLFPEADSRGDCPYDTSDASLNCRVYSSWLEGLYKDNVVDDVPVWNWLEDSSFIPF